MKEIFFASLAVLIHRLIKFLILPFLDHHRLFLGQISPHFKAGFRKQQRVFDFHNSPFEDKKSALSFPKGATLRGTTLVQLSLPSFPFNARRTPSLLRSA